MSDDVDHPAHYGGDTPYEVIKVLEQWLTPEEFIGYCKGQVIAYNARATRKGTELLDYQKGRWYQNRLVAFAAAAEFERQQQRSTVKSDLVQEVLAELQRAQLKFPAMRSPHEAWGILAEEFAELTEEIRRQDPDREAMRREAVQIAAMALRFVWDLCPKGT